MGGHPAPWRMNSSAKGITTGARENNIEGYTAQEEERRRAIKKAGDSARAAKQHFVEAQFLKCEKNGTRRGKPTTWRTRSTMAKRSGAIWFSPEV